MNWKPIKTAPKDGSWILVARTGIGSDIDMPPAVVKWVGKYRFIPGYDEEAYEKFKDDMSKFEGAWVGVDTGSVCLCEPKWWQPIDPNPSTGT